MPMMRGELEVNRQMFEVTYDSNGYGEPWYVTVGGETVRAKSETSLVSKIRTAIKRQATPVRIPFVSPTGGVGVVVGEHAGRRVTTIEWDGGGREHVNVDFPLRPDTDTARLRELIDALGAARQELAAFTKEHRLRGPNGAMIPSTGALLQVERERLVADAEPEPESARGVGMPTL